MSDEAALALAEWFYTPEYNREDREEAFAHAHAALSALSSRQAQIVITASDGKRYRLTFEAQVLSEGQCALVVVGSEEVRVPHALPERPPDYAPAQPLEPEPDGRGDVPARV